MAYTAVIEARRDAEGRFQDLEQAMRIKREKDRKEAEARRQPAPDAGMEAEFYALHSPTRMHIGLWPKKVDAYQVAQEYENCTVTPLVTLTSANARISAVEAERDALREVSAEAIRDILWKHRPYDCHEAYDAAAKDIDTLLKGDGK